MPGKLPAALSPVKFELSQLMDVADLGPSTTARLCLVPSRSTSTLTSYPAISVGSLQLLSHLYSPQAKYRTCYMSILHHVPQTSFASHEPSNLLHSAHVHRRTIVKDVGTMLCYDPLHSRKDLFN